jgi:FkbM family methyltransferase
MPAPKIATTVLLAVHHALEACGILRIPLIRNLHRSGYFLYKDWFEDNLKGLLRRYPHLASGGHIFDIGANVGYTSRVFLRYLSIGSKVFAFEPEERNFASLLSAHQAAIADGKLEAFRMALSAEDGSALLVVNRTNPGDHRIAATPKGSAAETQKITSRAADSFWNQYGDRKPIGLAKIDVQGYELPVLQGMSGIIEREKGLRIIVEYCPSLICEMGFEPEKLLRFFEERQFKLSVIGKGGTLEPASAAILEDKTRGGGYLDLLASRESLT